MNRATGVAVGIAFAIAFAAYALGTAPSVLYGDSAELQVAALTGGIPHGSGYPTFILVGRLFGALGWGDPAHRINLMSATFGAACVALLLIVQRALGLSLWSAAVGAAVYGSTFTVWRAAQRAEIYTLSITLALLALWRSIVALREGRGVLMAGFLLGLTMTGHLSFGIPVAALGLALAWRVVRDHRRVPLRLAALAGTFLLGLTPYLYLVWADARSAAFDYIRITQMVANPLGRPDPHFDTSWERVRWLVLGRSLYPTPPLAIEPRVVARNLAHAGAAEFLFELGPLAFGLVVLAMVRLRRGPLARVATTAVVLALSLLFAVSLSGGALLNIFLIPFTLMLALFMAFGLERVCSLLPQRWRQAPARSWVFGLAAALLLALPPHALRVWSADHPIVGKFQVSEEGGSSHQRARLIPSMRGEWEPRRFGEDVLRRVPRNALVVGYWDEFVNLSYFQLVEKRRPDLTLQPQSHEGLSERLALWQRAHALEAHPIVFLSRPVSLADHSLALDSLPLEGGRWFYVQRTPLLRRGAP